VEGVCEVKGGGIGDVGSRAEREASEDERRARGESVEEMKADKG
jgi:hypothetical protein